MLRSCLKSLISTNTVVALLFAEEFGLFPLELISEMDNLLFIPGDGVLNNINPKTLLIRDKRYALNQTMLDKTHHAVSISFIIFIILILLFNAFIIIVILLSKTMRSSSRHVLIISVCLGDLFMGVFVLPALFHSGIGHTTADCSTVYARVFFLDFLIPSVTTLAMLALNIDYILRLCCSSYSEGGSRTTFIALLFILPWLISNVVLISLFVVAMNKGTEESNTCNIDVGGALSRVLIVVSFFPQAGLLLVFNLIVSVLYLLRRESYSLDVCGERIRAPVDICLASFTTVLLYAPVCLITLLTTEGYLGCHSKDECRALYIMYSIALWMRFMKSWVLPLSWLACRDTRECIQQLLCCG